jgi:hypothetical protein
MELIDRVAALLGLAAFLGLGVLALLYFQQSREVRRLRDWAGRAPERAAAAAAEAETALAGAESEEGAEERGPSLRDRLRARWERWMGRLPRGLGERLPAPQYLGLIALAAVLIGVGVATSGFGLIGDDEPSKQKGKGAANPEKIDVAVLNSTGVTGLAAEIGDAVEKLGYKVGPITDIGTPFGESVVMYDDGAEADAQQVADDIDPQLGKTPLQKMTGEVSGSADGAGVALVIGEDDAQP